MLMREHAYAYIADGHSFVVSTDEQQASTNSPPIDLGSPWTTSDTLDLASLVAAPLLALPIIGASSMASLPGTISTQGIVAFGAAASPLSALGLMGCALGLLFVGARHIIQPLCSWLTRKSRNL